VYISGVKHYIRKAAYAMTSENQALLDAIRVVVTEAIAPLETEQRAQRVLLEGIDLRLTSVEARLTKVEARLTDVEIHVARLDEQYTLLEARTGQISRELFEMSERMDRGFSSVRSDLRAAFHDIIELRATQKGHDRRLKSLEDKYQDLQQRLAALERAQGDRSQ
jgi:chromosome segregation ATPase